VRPQSNKRKRKREICVFAENKYFASEKLLRILASLLVARAFNPCFLAEMTLVRVRNADDKYKHLTTDGRRFGSEFTPLLASPQGFRGNATADKSGRGAGGRFPSPKSKSGWRGALSPGSALT
jgi:hypothetical protein